MASIDQRRLHRSDPRPRVRNATDVNVEESQAQLLLILRFDVPLSN
jgi:hypothetical protein